MKLVVLGAGGGLGRNAVDAALAPVTRSARWYAEAIATTIAWLREAKDIRLQG